jgi:transposase
VLNQAAQTAKRSPDFAATYSAIAKRRGKKIATIAIARKLLTRAWHLLSRPVQGDGGEPAGGRFA